MKLLEIINKDAAPLIHDSGYEILGLSERHSQTNLYIVVTIDRLDGQPVIVKDCSRVTRIIENCFEGIATRNEYTLEVTSPGTKRPLLLPRHFINAIGKRVKIEYDTSEEEQVIKGQLINADEEKIELSDEIQEEDVIMISYNKIRKANIEV